MSQECRIQNNFDPTKPQHLRDARHAHLQVILNRNSRLYFDCHDSFEIDEDGAGEVDCYFKRSYVRPAVPESLRAKVFPLGLNYEVHSAELDTWSRQRISLFGEQSPSTSTPRFLPTVEMMHCRPGNAGPRILFITRAWDPFDNPDRSDAKVAERIICNDARARCIELLSREFGDRFLGGFMHADFAARNYPRQLLPDNTLSAKANYLRLLRTYSICIATTGLHGSTGWKMGEYVAFSRAIVSERLNSDVPGNFRAGQNYLEFSNPEECVNVVQKLLSDAGLRYAMMMNNYEYYLTYLRPDMMVRRCVEIGLSQPPPGRISKAMMGD